MKTRVWIFRHVAEEQAEHMDNLKNVILLL